MANWGGGGAMRIGVMGTPGGDVGGTPHWTLTYPTGYRYTDYTG